MSRAANRERDAKIVAAWQENKATCRSWQPIYELLCKTDEETFQYVLRQLCRQLGNNKFLIKPRKQKQLKDKRMTGSVNGQLTAGQMMDKIKQGISRKISVTSSFKKRGMLTKKQSEPSSPTKLQSCKTIVKTISETKTALPFQRTQTIAPDKSREIIVEQEDEGAPVSIVDKSATQTNIFNRKNKTEMTVVEEQLVETESSKASRSSFSKSQSSR
jgi:hypothetical protein